MTVVVAANDGAGDLVGDYERFVDSISVNNAQRSQRKRAARLFTERPPISTPGWLGRPRRVCSTCIV